MSDTPRTDDESFFPHHSRYEVCKADFARQLERELNAANERIRRLEEAGDALYENSDPTRWDLPGANARKLKEQEAWRKAKEAKP